jgi:tetratricopeptide (TPR) repeat protein
LATVSRAVEGGAAERERVVRIGVAMNFYCIARKRWEEWRNVTEQVGPLAVDPAAKGILLADLGLAHAELEDFGRASDALESAVAALEGVGSPEYQVSTLVNLSHVLERAGRQETGLQYGQQALEMAERTSDHEAQAMAALVVGMIYGVRQDTRYEEYFATAVSAMRAAGPPRGLAMVFHQIGVSHLEGGRYEAGERAVAESLRLYRDDDAVTYLPDVQETIGKLRLASGDPGSAVVQFNDALAGAIDLGQLDREASVRTKLAEALLLTGRSDDARSHLTKAVEIYRRLGTDAVERPLALLADLDAGSGGA